MIHYRRVAYHFLKIKIATTTTTTTIVITEMIISPITNPDTLKGKSTEGKKKVWSSVGIVISQFK